MTRRRGRSSLLLLARNAPGVAGSALIVGWVGHSLGWIGAVVALLLWACGGIWALTAAGERKVVVGMLGWTPIHLDEVLGFAATAQLGRAIGTSTPDFTFHAAPPIAAGPNTLAIGARSIGLTPDLIAAHTGPKVELEEDALVALLIHEIGHHHGGRTRGMTMTVCLQYPVILLFGPAAMMLNRLVLAVPLAGVILGIGAGLLPLMPFLISETAFVLGLLLIVVVVPGALLALGVLARAEEHRADEYVVKCGYGESLIEGLRFVGEPDLNWWERVVATHPQMSDRQTRIREQLSAGGA